MSHTNNPADDVCAAPDRIEIGEIGMRDKA
jgi:hypothetical protein